MRHAFSLSVLCSVGLAAAAHAQVQQHPIGATMRFEVAHACGPWTDLVFALPGDRIEWRVVISYTGTSAAAALGRIYYQPLIINADINGEGSNRDQLGTWRNGGSSGQGNTTLAQGLLTPAEGQDSCPLVNGYGRVRFGFTSRSTTAGGSGPLMGHLHTPGVGNDTPLHAAGFMPTSGGFIRIAGANATSWYPSNINICDFPPCPSTLISWGNVADNNSAASTWFMSGTQNIVIFRQSITVSGDSGTRCLAISAEPASLMYYGVIPGITRNMMWATTGQGGSTASIRAGVEFIPAIIALDEFPISVCNDIDFNNDGSLFDPQDIEAFLSTYSEGPCVPIAASCDSIDFNTDGSLFDPCDITSFLIQYSEGPCTHCGI